MSKVKHTVVRPRDQGLTQRIVPDRGEQRVGRVGLRLVGEVDPREEMPQQPARQHADADVRGLAVGGARLDGDELEAPLGVGRAAAEAGRSRPRAAAPRACPPGAGSGRGGWPARSRPARRRPARRRRRSPRRRSGSRPGRRARRAARRPRTAARTRRTGRRSATASLISLHRRRLAAAQHDVEPVAERPLGLGGPEVEARRSSARAPSGRGPTGRSGPARTAGRRGSTSG